MSKYAYINGSISYTNLEDFEKAKTFLVKGGWCDATGVMIDEMGNKTGNVAFQNDSDRMVIDIGADSYRNLILVIDQLSRGGNVDGLWASNDGCFEGGELLGKKADLRALATEFGDEQPVQEEGESDDEFAERLSEWEDYVCHQFTIGSYE